MLEIPLSGIKKIEEIANSSNEYISLSQGSIKIGGIPEQVKEYVRALLKTDITDYYGSCWGLKVLREKLADVLSKNHGTTITSRQVIPTHGCIGGLSLLYLTLLNPGDEVIIPEPAYPAYSTLLQAVRGKAVYVSCLKATTDDSSGIAWEMDVEKIKDATTSRTKFIIFSNPCNPLGMIISKKTILELLEWCEKKEIYLIIDEAYRDYVFAGSFYSSLECINQSEWVISANTFSKNMAMSGWRIGYLIIPEKLNKALAGMQDALLNCLNNTAQYAALYALDHPEFTQTFHKQVKSNRDMAMNMLTPLLNQGIFSCTTPQGGFFIFLKTDQEDATNLCLSILNKAKVGLIPGASFGAVGAPFIRLCYARNPEVLEEGITRLLNYFL